MGGEWRRTHLGDIIELKRGYDLPQARRLHGNVPIVSSSGVTDYHAEAMVKAPGVVTGRYGTLGQVFFVEQDFWPLNTALYVRDFKGNDPRFISYFLRGLDFLAYSDKAAVPGLNRNHLHEASVYLPSDISEQRAIAHVLGTLDDKIELNRRMNETLEAMARAIFQSWFVDFDPVRAKAEGCPTGLLPHIDALFPSAFQDSELGPIPEGWECGTIGDVATHPRRAIQAGDLDPTSPYIALEHMPKRSIALSEWTSAEGLESGKFGFKRGEILFGKLRSYFHKVGIAPVDGVCSTDIVPIAPKGPDWSAFVLAHVSSDAFVAYTDAGSGGTRMPRTSWADMSRFAVALPPTQLAAAFASVVSPLLERIIASIHESRTLAALREALLPKLMSGEIRVGEAARELEAVG